MTRTRAHHRAAATALAVATLALAQLPAATTASARPRLGHCGAGQLCLWPHADFAGARSTHELADTDIETCVPLPAGTAALSVANRTKRPVTTYQSAHCGDTGEFDTYPTGSYAPRSGYLIRAFKIWER